MKKRTMGLIALVLVMAVVAIGCSGKTVADFAKENMSQSDIDAINETMGGLMTMTVETTDNELIINCTYSADIPAEMIDASAIDEQMEAQRPTVEALVEQMKKEVKVDNPAIVYVYYDSEGNELSRTTFQ